MISVVTPLSASGNQYIEHTFRSLIGQSYDGPWEWIVLENMGGVLPDHIAQHPCVKRTSDATPFRGIGRLKRLAAELARGDILIELDHDDALTPNAFAEIAQAISRGYDFVYSDFAEFDSETGDPHVYSARYGWDSYAIGNGLRAMVAPPPTPQNMRSILFAPNHVRAWRRSAYVAVGGHNPDWRYADDHDLVCRTYLASPARVHHIPLCLYLYRVHRAQTVATANAELQVWASESYEIHIEALARSFCRQESLRAIDLCSGISPRPGHEPADVRSGVDLNSVWPWPDSSVGLFRAQDALEHLRDPVHTMNEAYRCLAPGGFFLTSTPSTDGRGAFCDPTHVSFWNELSFRYYADPVMQRLYLPQFVGRFAMSRPARTYHPSEWHEHNRVPYVEAHLLALKPGYHHMGGA